MPDAWRIACPRSWRVVQHGVIIRRDRVDTTHHETLHSTRNPYHPLEASHGIIWWMEDTADCLSVASGRLVVKLETTKEKKDQQPVPCLGPQRAEGSSAPNGGPTRVRGPPLPPSFPGRTANPIRHARTDNDGSYQLTLAQFRRLEGLTDGPIGSGVPHAGGRDTGADGVTWQEGEALACIRHRSCFPSGKRICTVPL
ncbi:hypothetical protein E2C01_030200 [Portunus trituberculatus]|uniref:Uncharacterized protein n=1 Tax=Portunus trituberculatus TaxID=210409 RepID=A0A5B7ERG0_PORTR|nr:hypothetical protein [Portunus trituberculatus]